ncbi:MAG: hypothetical protein NVSMB51_22230 [Solirubrobacteraceae bacterium]
MTGLDEALDALPMLAASPWQMSYGERAALEGVVAQIKPRLAIEIGTAEGGSLRRIAAHSREVHSFDLVRPAPEVAALDNVTFHTGDSHQLLPAFLDELAADGRSVDFILVDGDHSAEGVKLDLEHILASDAVQRTVILLHDTMNDVVRDGIQQVPSDDHRKLVLMDLDFVPGYLARREPYRLQLWGGLGLIVVDAEQHFNAGGKVRQDRFHDLFAVIRPTRDVMVAVEASGSPLDALDGEALEQRMRVALPSGQPPAAGDAEALRAQALASAALLSKMQGAASWRLTAPLRALKRRVGARLRG